MELVDIPVLETGAEICIAGSTPALGTKVIKSVDWQTWRDVSQGYTLRISSNTQLSNGV